jgi:ABC-type xylose transport system permease subunit
MVFNGLGLIGVNVAVQGIATAIVLIAAVTIDSVIWRRGAGRS